MARVQTGKKALASAELAGHRRGAPPQLYVSFGALLVSCITGGRKTYLRDKLRTLRTKKGELEAEIKKRNVGRKMSIVGGCLKIIGQLDVEGGGLRGAEEVGKGTRVVPIIGGEEITKP